MMTKPGKASEFGRKADFDQLGIGAASEKYGISKKRPESVSPLFSFLLRDQDCSPTLLIPLIAR